MFCILIVNWFLSVLDMQVLGMLVVGNWVIVQVFVEICMPINCTVNTEFIYISWLGINVNVQYVFMTPKELTLQVNVTDLR